MRGPAGYLALCSQKKHAATAKCSLQFPLRTCLVLASLLTNEDYLQAHVAATFLSLGRLRGISQQLFLPSAAARDMSRPQRSLQPLANARANMKATGMRALPPPTLLTAAGGVGAKGRVGLEPEADQALK